LISSLIGSMGFAW